MLFSLCFYSSLITHYSLLFVLLPTAYCPPPTAFMHCISSCIGWNSEDFPSHSRYQPVPWRMLSQSPLPNIQLERKVLTSRALRRHHEKRIKRRVEQYYSGVHRNDPRRIGQMARARKLCSCWMCGNPRRYFNEPTLREKRLEEES